MVVFIKDYAKGASAISYEDGKKCFDAIANGIKQNGNNDNMIVLDFAGIEFVITAFLNPVIGDMILNYGSDIMSKVQIRNANGSIIEKIKLVKDGALLKREDMDEG
ncbi:STAS-like domain-containing protein [uncultured Gemmiger sp.]|uniref:STAS-like domain-containing protein n=1 Tax=uncultured Gemmiger sp. TaxID=1623490 RepID=UPI0025ECDE79|nr:STAS-like domain-containing protein [uncultured Gemmiger sp.]